MGTTKVKTKPQRESKAGTLEPSGAVQQADLDLINQYTRTPLTADQVYTFKLQLCDNEIDRQFDQFTPNALKQLAALFIGKTVLLDHVHSAKNQFARIYGTTVEAEQGKKNSAGEPYQRLTAMAYMLNIPANADTIAALDGGILKEGSVAFTCDTHTCSICGKEFFSPDCPHCKGQIYDGKTCFTALDDITDAYEFSLVAVPAQRTAGVTKQFKDGRTISADTLKKLSAARKLRDKALDCTKQARAIEDELVGEWPDDDDPDDDPEDTPPDDNPPDDSDETKAFKAKIKFLIGGKTE